MCSGSVNSKYINAYSEAAHLGGSASKYVYTSIKCHYTNTNIIHALRDINNSIFIIGGSDVPNTKEIISEYQYYNPSIDSLIIENTKLFPQIEKPEECVGMIKLFLNEE